MAELAAIKACIRRILGREQLRLTPIDLRRHIGAQIRSADPRAIRNSIHQMVADGELIYTQQCGTTHIQMAGAGALHLGGAAEIRPAPADLGAVQRRPVVRLMPGLSFGAGDHPTTCLALEGLKEAVNRLAERVVLDRVRVLDIGTGSGVLVIAAALLGVGWSLGIDIDAASCSEARRNVLLNEVTGKVGLVAGTLDTIGRGAYDLVLANLRPPTLVALMPRMAGLLKEKGWWILSGFRPDGVDGVIRAFPEKMAVQWTMQNRGWAALVAQRL